MLHSFTTAATDTTETTSDLELLPAVATLLGNTITAHRENWEILPIQMTAPLNPTDPIFSDVAILIESGKIGLSHEDSLEINSNLAPAADPQFLYYVGNADDYAGSERLLTLRGWYLIFQREEIFYPIAIPTQITVKLTLPSPSTTRTSHSIAGERPPHLFQSPGCPLGAPVHPVHPWG